ncbi:hypothetical protein [Nonomuraea sp. NPDC050691]|uniref:hypothetical protein n=1 Tax=Nonomuraea sp. NPDC050691 TaxID=3155661 RepID=UPI0033D08BC6
MPERFLAMTLAVCLAVSACAVDSRSAEYACVAQASTEMEELRDAVSASLPFEVAETFQGNHSCDSGAKGGWVSFEADRSVSGYALLQKFRDKGWDVVDMRRDDCVACVAGVSKTIDGKLVEVTVMDRPGASLEVMASHS